MNRCPYCGKILREGAKFCGCCGQNLERPASLPATSPSPPPAETRPAPVSTPIPPSLPPTTPQWSEERNSSIWAWLKQLPDSLRTWFLGEDAAGGPSHDGAAQVSTPTQAHLSPRTGPLRLDREPIPLFAGRYVTMRHDLKATFGFYEVYDLHCVHCGVQNRVGHGERCTNCHQPLPVLLLHASRVQVRPELRTETDLRTEDIIQLSREHPFILDHVAIWSQEDRLVVALAYPPGWKALHRRVPVQDSRQVAAWGIQLGEALAYLHGRQVVHFGLDVESFEGLVIHEGKAKFSDLSKARALVRMEEGQTRRWLQRDILFLAKAVCYMATGQTQPLKMESPFQGVFNRAMNDEYASIGHLLDDLKAIQAGQQVSARVSFSTGEATHEGKVRPANEDSVLVLPMAYSQGSQKLATALCVVADGMGGHQAGDTAAKIARKIIAEEIIAQLLRPALDGSVTRKLYVSSGEILKEAVEKANHKVYEMAQKQRTNMGTTITAALLEGPKAYVVNVGDSRTYRLRDGLLEKLTEDHSLVASLVKAGTISEEEIYTHPQRNQIYRSLGQKVSVEVDLFETDLKKGDQLLLCSDGLWEMVRDPQIRDILRQAPNPQVACDRLVQTAYDVGGEDNITVAVVKVE